MKVETTIKSFIPLKEIVSTLLKLDPDDWELKEGYCGYGLHLTLKRGDTEKDITITTKDVEKGFNLHNIIDFIIKRKLANFTDFNDSLCLVQKLD